jgi:hypothetical protein
VFPEQLTTDHVQLLLNEEVTDTGLYTSRNRWSRSTYTCECTKVSAKRVHVHVASVC